MFTVLNPGPLSNTTLAAATGVVGSIGLRVGVDGLLDLILVRQEICCRLIGTRPNRGIAWSLTLGLLSFDGQLEGHRLVVQLALHEVVGLFTWQLHFFSRVVDGLLLSVLHLKLKMVSLPGQKLYRLRHNLVL